MTTEQLGNLRQRYRILSASKPGQLVSYSDLLANKGGGVVVGLGSFDNCQTLTIRTTIAMMRG
jgi:hypothetical protein